MKFESRSFIQPDPTQKHKKRNRIQHKNTKKKPDPTQPDRGREAAGGRRQASAGALREAAGELRRDAAAEVRPAGEGRRSAAGGRGERGGLPAWERREAAAARGVRLGGEGLGVARVSWLARPLYTADCGLIS
jgi:hypothetical protein